MQQTRTYFIPNIRKFGKVFAILVLVMSLTVQFWFPLLRRSPKPMDSCAGKPFNSIGPTTKNGRKQIVKRDCVINLNNRKYDSVARISPPKELRLALKRIKIMQRVDTQSRKKESNSIASVPPFVHKKDVHKDNGRKTNDGISRTNERKNNIGLHFVGFGYQIKKLN